MPSKSSRCSGRSLASARSRPSSVVGEDHLAHRRRCARRSKNMCSVRQRPMPSAPKASARSRACSGVSALARTPSRRALSAQLHELRELRCGLAGASARSARSPRQTSPARAVDRGEPRRARRRSRSSPFGGDGHLPLRRSRSRARSQPATHGLAHLARDDRRVRRHAAARGEDALRRPVMPRMSSGEVSMRTRMTVLAARSAALVGVVGAEARPRPAAAPGDAARGPWRASAFASALRRSKSGAGAGSSCSGSTRSSASSRSISFSLHHVDGDLHRGRRRCACRRGVCSI